MPVDPGAARVADPLGYAMLHPMPKSIKGNRLQNYMNTDFTVLVRQEESIILHELHTLNGRSTIVVEWRRGKDFRQRWWLDPALGLAVVKHESFAGQDDGSVYLYLQVEFSDFEEIEPDLFMPGSDVSRSFKPDGAMSDERISPQIALDTKAEIDDSIFVLEFPDNTRVEDDRFFASNWVRAK